MDKFKQFIKKKKLDSKFKKLGGGYQLGEHADGPGGVAHSGESLKQHVGDGDRRQQQVYRGYRERLVTGGWVPSEQEKTAVCG